MLGSSLPGPHGQLCVRAGGRQAAGVSRQGGPMPVVVSLEDERKRKPSLDALGSLVAADLKRVNEIILARMQSKVPLIPELAGHIIAAGGKRLRPMLTLATARLCGHAGDRHLGLAASVEFIHTATLLHDDVVDESALRR